jgi:3-deoxy-D-manno-octulosonate 8-phosphate phosphatase (KDO 8-P phosphatase)
MSHENQQDSAPEPRLAADAAARARRVKLILMDVDGVLTDGRIVFCGPTDETKFFDSQDGMGVRQAIRAGLRVALITRRGSRALERRAKELGISEIHTDSLDKSAAYTKILRTSGLSDAEVAFVGDDLVDMPALGRAGFAATVPNAVPEVIRAAHFVAGRPGGRGAVRQILDFILKVQGRWERATREDA